jgi:hypothetical protein
MRGGGRAGSDEDAAGGAERMVKGGGVKWLRDEKVMSRGSAVA